DIEFKLCSDCYQISSGWIESTLTKKTIPILYLPWWDAYYQCTVCDKTLEFKSDCQKWCFPCKIIYVGCRYCLTTNIIFGITDQTQCKKCERIFFIIIDIANICSGNSDIDDFLDSIRINLDNNHQQQIANYMSKNSNQLDVYNFE